MDGLLKRLGMGLVALSLGVTSTALAAQWVYIGDSQDGQSYYLDFDSLKGTGQARTFWARGVNDNGNTESLIKFSVDCDRRQVGVIEAIEYSPSGAVRSHHNIDSAVGGTWEFAPGTIAESYYDFICSRLTRQPMPETTSEARASEYPKAACGDPAPSTLGEHRLYPVFADYSPGTLRYINNKLCRDALPTERENGKLSIQVASFTDKNRAIKFAAFLKEQVGSGLVGEPATLINR